MRRPEAPGEQTGTWSGDCFSPTLGQGLPEVETWLPLRDEGQEVGYLFSTGIQRWVLPLFITQTYSRYAISPFGMVLSEEHFLQMLYRMSCPSFPEVPLSPVME